jgi:hypothetical protein
MAPGALRGFEPPRFALSNARRCRRVVSNRPLQRVLHSRVPRARVDAAQPRAADDVLRPVAWVEHAFAAWAWLALV